MRRRFHELQRQTGASGVKGKKKKLLLPSQAVTVPLSKATAEEPRRCGREISKCLQTSCNLLRFQGNFLTLRRNINTSEAFSADHNMSGPISILWVEERQNLQPHKDPYSLPLQLQPCKAVKFLRFQV